AMTHSTYAQPLPRERVSDAAFGYNAHGLQLTSGYNIMPELAAAGLWATPSDLALFGITMMKALKGQSSVISKESAEAMTTATYENSPYGVGFAVAPGKKGFTFGHSGSNIGYRCNMCFCPADGSGMVVMHNSDIGANIIGEVTNAFKTVSGW
ncbi:MAG: beta-lactamase family protein, partial [Symbiobacteriaceae bacterium]|nr:beta-lactamase family protein [Symbiobacteriaceae bacterium]